MAGRGRGAVGGPVTTKLTSALFPQLFVKFSRNIHRTDEAKEDRVLGFRIGFRLAFAKSITCTYDQTVSVRYEGS